MRETCKLIVLLFLPWCQTHSQWQLRLATGDTLSDVILKELCADSLEIVHHGEPHCIAVNSIDELRFVHPAGFWSGATRGFGIGALLGTIFGTAALYNGEQDTQGEIVFIAASAGLAGGIVGGAIGAVAGIDNVYDFSANTLPEKLTTIKLVLAREEPN